MEHLILKTLPDVLRHFSVPAYLLVFLGGILTSMGPCNLSMVPVIMAYVTGTAEPTRARGLTISTVFTLGSSTTFAVLGLLAAGVGHMAGPRHATLFYIVAAVCFVVGLSLLGVLNVNLSLAGIVKLNKMPKPGHIGAYFLGLVVGLAGSQCGMPVLVAILSIVMAEGKIAYGTSLLFAYGLGRGVPIVAAGTFTGLVKSVPILAKWTTYAEKAAGVVMLTIGMYFLWSA